LALFGTLIHDESPWETIMRRGLRLCALVLSLTMIGANTAEAGFFQRLWELEQRKNQWLRDTFFPRRDQPVITGEVYYSGTVPNGTTETIVTPQGQPVPQQPQAQPPVQPAPR
jgi:hypothetical protein